MVTPLAHQKIQTSTGAVSIPIYNPADVSYPNLRVMTSNGLGAYDLVATSDTLPLRIMTPDGIKSFNTVPISDGGSGEPPIVKDSFNRTNSTTLGTTETGQTWQSYGTSNVWGVQSNAAYPITPDWDQPVYIEAGISDNVAFQVRINTVHEQQQIMWRIVDGNENYFLIQGNEVYSSIGGSGYNSLGIISPGIVSGDVIRIELTGEKHVILVNNIPKLTFYDSTHINGTKFGFSSNSTTLRIDDFLIENLVPPSVPATNITEDFLDDTYTFTYLQDPTYPWNRFNTASIDGNLGHIKSSHQTIGPSNSNIIFDILVPSGTASSWIEVDYGVDSELNFDFMYLYVDGIEVLKISGLNTGMYTKILTAGSHTLRVRYSKDVGANTGTDSAYISGIRLKHT